MTAPDRLSDVTPASSAGPSPVVSAGGLAAALWRARLWIVLPVIVATGLAVLWLSSVTPLYKSTAKVLVEDQETAYTRPATTVTEQSLLDQESIRSQVQLILSADLSRQIIASEGLDRIPEFNPASSGGLLSRILSLFGVTRSRTSMTNEEKVLARYYKRLTVFQVDQSRVIAIEFSSQNPELAARIANAVADGYIAMQKSAKRSATREATDWLESQISTLRTKVDDAERKVEQYRTEHGLFATLRGSTEPTTLSEQQLSELTTQLALARAQKSDAQAKARQIRETLETGGPIESNEVLNSALIQGLVQQQVTLRAQIAELSATLGPRHPRMLQLNAQLGDLRRQIRDEAMKYARAAENEAAIAADREQEILSDLDTLKARAAQSNEKEVELRALERDAKSERDLLESLLGRYREATARDNLEALPADARIISRAAPAIEPYYPKTVATILAVFFGTLVLTCGIVITVELFRSVGEQPAGPMMPTPVGGGAGPGSGGGPRRTPTSGRGDGGGSGNGAGNRAEAATVETFKPGLDGIRDRIMLSSSGEIGHTVLITSMRARDDGDDIPVRIARLIAALGRRVVVADARLGDQAGLSPDDEGETAAPGLTELLTGAAPFEQAIQRDRLSRVHVIGAGAACPDPVSLLTSERMETVLEALRLTYDVVFLVAPPVVDGEDALVLSGKSDQAIVFAGSEDGEASLRRTRDGLEEAGAGQVDIVDTGTIDAEFRAAAAA